MAAQYFAPGNRGLQPAELHLLLTKSFGIEHPVLLIAKFLHFKDLGGYFIAQFTLIGIIAFMSDIFTGIISGFITRSARMAAITFFSALAFQILVVAVYFPLQMKLSQTTMEQGIAREKLFQQFAKIENITCEVQEPFEKYVTVNLNTERVKTYAKLIVNVSVAVKKAGTYWIWVDYNGGKKKSLKRELSAGNNLVAMEFLAHESGDYGYPPPELKKKVVVELDWMTSQRALAGRGSSQLDINKFVERKEAQF